MVMSMTGYGRGEADDACCRIVVEIRSVNSRYCDIQIRLPRILSPLENVVRDLLKQRLSRGKIDVFISFEAIADDAVTVKCDYNLAQATVAALRRIAAANDIPDGLNAVNVSRLNEIMRVEQTELPVEQTRDVLVAAVNLAVQELCTMRQLEGARLAQDIAIKAKQLQTMWAQLGQYAPLVVEKYKERLTSRLAVLLADQAQDILPADRLVAEVALFADKSSIDEELVRLESHLGQLPKILAQTEPVGKKLDFLIQEINREVNTIGAKANDLDLTRIVVAMKSEIEKIREQVQNIE